jgi:predicted phosphodiesterase
MTQKQQAAKAVVERFPKLGARTLGRKLYAENRGLFKSYDLAYQTVRRCLGVAGRVARANMSDKSSFREPRGFHVDHFDDIPDPIPEPWEPFKIEAPCRALVISDVHIPFHDPVALKCALREGKRRKVDTVVLNGDICDCHDQSKFEKDPTKKVWPEEIRVMRTFLDVLRKEFKQARIVYKMGNHEERYVHYMMRNCPIYLDIPEFNFEEIMHLNKHGIAMVGDKRRISLGEHFDLMHGHEYGNGSSRNPADKLFQNAKSHCLCGHFHRSGHFSTRTLTDHVISTWAAGCLCQLHPKYRPANDWNHGFSVVEVDRSSAFQVQNFRIFDGQVYQ